MKTTRTYYDFAPAGNAKPPSEWVEESKQHANVSVARDPKNGNAWCRTITGVVGEIQADGSFKPDPGQLVTYGQLT
jgi:hypothetical protein